MIAASIVFNMLLGSVQAFVAARTITSVLGEAQESSAVQTLCKIISDQCHDKCNALRGLAETACFSECIAWENARKVPLSIRKEIIDPLVKKIDSFFIGKIVGAAVDAQDLERSKPCMKVNTQTQPLKNSISPSAEKEESSKQKDCSALFSCIFSRKTAADFCEGFVNALFNQFLDASSHKAKAAWGTATVFFTAIALPFCAQSRKIQVEQPKKAGNHVERNKH